MKGEIQKNNSINMKRSEFYLKILDFVKKTKIRQYFNFFLDTLNWSYQEIQAYQIKKIRELIQYANKHVQYYSEIFKKNNITPDSIKTLEDLKKIPLLNRIDIQENFG